MSGAQPRDGGSPTGGAASGAASGANVDPSMEDILASIRRILSEEDAPAAAPDEAAERQPGVFLLDSSMLVADAAKENPPRPEIQARSAPPPPPPLLTPAPSDVVPPAPAVRPWAQDMPSKAAASDPPVERTPTETTTGAAPPVDAEDGAPEPPVAARPEPLLLHTSQLEPAPDEAAPTETAADEPAPIETARTETAAVETAPIEPTQAAPQRNTPAAETTLGEPAFAMPPPSHPATASANDTQAEMLPPSAGATLSTGLPGSAHPPAFARPGTSDDAVAAPMEAPLSSDAVPALAPSFMAPLPGTSRPGVGEEPGGEMAGQPDTSSAAGPPAPQARPSVGMPISPVLMPVPRPPPVHAAYQAAGVAVPGFRVCHSTAASGARRAHRNRDGPLRYGHVREGRVRHGHLWWARFRPTDIRPADIRPAGVRHA